MGTYLSAIDLVTQNQLTIVARYGVNPSDRMLGDVSPGQAIITVNNSSTTARQVGPLVAAEFNVTKSLSLVDNMGGGQRFSSDQLLNFYSTPSSGYTSFNQQSGFNFGSLSLTATNFTSQLFNTPGTYSWTVPAGVTSISVAGIGGGGGGSQKSTGGGGGGGGLMGYSNSIAVTPGTTCTIVVGSGGVTGGTYGENGSSTYMLLPGSNIPIVIAQGGAGGDRIYWTDSSQGVTYTDNTGTITTQAAYDPAGGTISYSISAGSLPTGASLNVNTGAISWVAQSVSTSTEYTFTLSASNGSQTITKPFSLKILKYSIVALLEYLVVAGGGGGAFYGGGGGAGGLLTGTNYAVSSGIPIIVTIGGGGAGCATGGIPGTGANSSFTSTVTTPILAYGGGYGYGGPGRAGSGGSGGGGGTNMSIADSRGYGVYPGSLYISAPRQGYDGSDGTTANTDYSAGGGGAGGGGVSGSYSFSGGGGIGLSSSITGTSVTYAGGGGGGGWIGGGTGGSGVGGAGGGGNGGNGGNGATNTGSGGGGGGYGAAIGGTGGSGVVIIRYLDSTPAASATTNLAAGYPVVSGGYRIYKWITSGTITF